MVRGYRVIVETTHVHRGQTVTIRVGENPPGQWRGRFLTANLHDQGTGELHWSAAAAVHASFERACQAIDAMQRACQV